MLLKEDFYKTKSSSMRQSLSKFPVKEMTGGLRIFPEATKAKLPSEWR